MWFIYGMVIFSFTWLRIIGTLVSELQDTIHMHNIYLILMLHDDQVIL